MFGAELSGYAYEIIFADDCSPDKGCTWKEIKRICGTDKRVKGVHNISNFGIIRNLFSCLKYGDGDAVFLLMGDMQDPPDLLPEFIRAWESGAKVIVGQKENAHENAIKRFYRKAYYKLIDLFAQKKQISNFTGYGLYDRSFIGILDCIDDMQPYLKGIVSEFGGEKVHVIPYTQRENTRKSNLNFIRNYDYAMAGITGYAKNLLRACTFVGIGIGVMALFFSVLVLINKLRFWDDFQAGIPSVLIGVFFLGAVQLFFLGIIGEYILSINERSMKRPLVIADERLNFEAQGE
jgi:glycosyltransferase involved in cell wall biosynthesis